MRFLDYADINNVAVVLQFHSVEPVFGFLRRARQASYVVAAKLMLVCLSLCAWRPPCVDLLRATCCGCFVDIGIVAN